MFSCIYRALKYWIVFYVPNQSVPNTQRVKSDYIIYRELSGKGLNLGIKYTEGYFVPITILVSKAINLKKYVINTDVKIVSKLIITDTTTDAEIDNIVYSNDFIIHT